MRKTTILRSLIHRLHDMNAAAAAVELDEAIDQGEERIVASLADALTGLEDGAQLPHEDIPAADLFAAESLHAAALGVGIAAVAAGTLTFLMCHDNHLTYCRYSTCVVGPHANRGRIHDGETPIYNQFFPLRQRGEKSINVFPSPLGGALG